MAIIVPEILRYKANRIVLMEMQVERRRMEFNIDAEQSILGGCSNFSQEIQNPEEPQTQWQQAAGCETTIWSSPTSYRICPQDTASKNSFLN